MKISKNKDKIAGNQSNISHMIRTMLKYLTLSNRNGLHYRSTNYVIRAARVQTFRHTASKQRGHLSAHASEGQSVEYANCEILAKLKIELSVNITKYQLI